MKIIPLNCPNCGTTLEIGENKEQLACGTCGSQLFVDRSGGAISLELAKSLGVISTGATQTAAELALVRLEKELNDAKEKVERLESLESRIQHFKTNNEQNIMSESKLKSANQRVSNLNAEKNSHKFLFIKIIATILLIIVSIIFVLNFGQSGWKILESLVWYGVVTYVLGLGVFGACDYVEKKHQEQLNKNLNNLNQQIISHNSASESRKELEENKFSISYQPEALAKARALVARIEAEIAHNKKIVSLR
jgi:hypothetical protein